MTVGDYRAWFGWVESYTQGDALSIASMPVPWDGVRAEIDGCKNTMMFRQTPWSGTNSCIFDQRGRKGSHWGVSE